MKKLKLDSYGFSHIELAVAVFVVAVISVIGIHILTVSHADSPSDILYVGSQGYVSTLNPTTAATASLQYGYDPTWANNASEVFFANWNGQQGIYSMTAAGQNSTKISNYQVRSNLAWSETAQKLAFSVANTSNLNENVSLYTMNPDGSGSKLIYTNLNGIIQGIRWSPDGTKLAFQVALSSGGLDLVVINAQTGAVILSTPANYFPSSDTNYWNSTSNSIVFANNGSVYEINLVQNGNSLSNNYTPRLILKALEPQSDYSQFMNVSWSPNGSTIVANSNGYNLSTSQIEPTVNNIFTFNSNGSDFTKIASFNNTSIDTEYDWSPDSNQIVTEIINGNGPYTSVYLISLSTGNSNIGNQQSPSGSSTNYTAGAGTTIKELIPSINAGNILEWSIQ